MDYIASLKILQNRKASADSHMNRLLEFTEKFADECGMDSRLKESYPHLDKNNRIFMAFVKRSFESNLPRGIDVPERSDIFVEVFPDGKRVMVTLLPSGRDYLKAAPRADFYLNAEDSENYEDFRKDFYNGLKETLEKLTERYTGRTSVKAVRNRKADGNRIISESVREIENLIKSYESKGVLDFSDVKKTVYPAKRPEGLDTVSLSWNFEIKNLDAKFTMFITIGLWDEKDIRIKYSMKSEYYHMDEKVSYPKSLEEALSFIEKEVNLNIRGAETNPDRWKMKGSSVSSARRNIKSSAMIESLEDIYDYMTKKDTEWAYYLYDEYNGDDPRCVIEFGDTLKYITPEMENSVYEDTNTDRPWEEDTVRLKNPPAVFEISCCIDDEGYFTMSIVDLNRGARYIDAFRVFDESMKYSSRDFDSFHKEYWDFFHKKGMQSLKKYAQDRYGKGGEWFSMRTRKREKNRHH